ncbi:MAG: helix-turn-helix transcriptional regulator [Treponema sp.]|nr:helix-turn-helix transcriptional regulator [Treponema sp.]
MTTPLETIFRDNLRFYRQKAKLSQEKLSALLDKNINYINVIESGKSVPPIAMIERIAKILQVEPKCFLESFEKTEKKYFDKEDFIKNAQIEIANSTESILRKLLETSTNRLLTFD